MSPIILLAIVVGLPLVLTVALRVKPLYVFVSIASGYFGALFLGDPLELIVGSVLHVQHIDAIARLLLLLLPLFITLILMRKTLSATALPFQFVLLLADSLLLASFIVSYLPAGVQGALYATKIGNVFRQSHDVLIPAVAGLHTLLMWIMRPRHHDEHSKRKKH